MLFRLFSTKFHGYLDYTFAALMPVIPRALGFGPAATRVHDVIGIATLGSAMLTDYELGAARVMPMRGHLAADAAIGAALLTAAAMLDEESDCARDVMAGLGVFSLIAAVCTKTEAGDGARRRRTSIYGRQPADHDVVRPGAAVRGPEGAVVGAAAHI